MKTISILKDNETQNIEIFEGETLLEVIQRSGNVIEATCGGKGTCNKCTVIVNGQLIKSCTTMADNGMSVKLDDPVSGARILTQSLKVEYPIIPIFEDLKDGFGLAVDIGTTTVAAYLFDIADGNEITVKSTMNPQKVFGADVISRIEYTSNGPEERMRMHKSIVNCIQEIIESLNLTDDLAVMAITGNTTMLHFFMNLDAQGIAQAPFTPETTEMQIFTSDKLGFNSIKTRVVVLPAVSAYVGADTISAVIATGLYKSTSPKLLVDIGTNGEIALMSKGIVWACSTAAGPAFEGANITFGMPALDGAISKVWLGEKDICYKTIGDLHPEGLCGSAVLDIVAILIKIGVVSSTGRMINSDEADEEWIAGKILRHNNANAFLISDDIFITQKDVREIQNAKAAICAGITILVQRAGISLTDIDVTYLAGGFGNFMDKTSAVQIGLIPEELLDTCVTAGNAAGQGACMSLLNKDFLDKSNELSKTIKYIELSYDPDFSDCYMDNMMFGDD